ncbi:MAG: hypothetical protein ABWW65_01295 [Thermoprotei archaeon]
MSSSSISEVRRLKDLLLVSGLIALAIILRFFEIPYPPAPFLKYDLSGVPLIVIAYISLKYAYISLPVYYLVSTTLLASDPIGMAMKVLAEFSTFTPLVIAYKKLMKRKPAIAAGISIGLAAVSRVLVMLLANYVITPYWLLWAGWAKSLNEAYSYLLFYIPHITIFNATIVIIIGPVALASIAVLKRTGYIIG